MVDRSTGSGLRPEGRCIADTASRICGHWRCRRRGNGRVGVGFTIVELLVVIAIISVLAAILFPMFARARSRAQRAHCVSNMSQLAKACHAYIQDWDGMYPPVLAASCPPALKCWTWQDAVFPYVASKDVFLCPTNPIGWDFDRLQLGPDPLSDFAVFISGRFPVSYEMSFGTRDNEIMISVPRIDSGVQNPSSWIMLMETRGTPGADPWDLAESVVLKDEGRALWAVHGHGGGANWAFFDGHVRWLPFERTLEPEWLWGDFEMSTRWRQALIDRVRSRGEGE
ncbi:MAG: prepilin-type N-terminal cleavage/methylation domain-containing protein [Armatimonadota bacterium]